MLRTAVRPVSETPANGNQNPVCRPVPGLPEFPPGTRRRRRIRMFFRRMHRPRRRRRIRMFFRRRRRIHALVRMVCRRRPGRWRRIHALVRMICRRRPGRWRRIHALVRMVRRRRLTRRRVLPGRIGGRSAKNSSGRQKNGHAKKFSHNVSFCCFEKRSGPVWNSPSVLNRKSGRSGAKKKLEKPEWG